MTTDTSETETDGIDRSTRTAGTQINLWKWGISIQQYHHRKIPISVKFGKPRS